MKTRGNVVAGVLGRRGRRRRPSATGSDAARRRGGVGSVQLRRPRRRRRFGGGGRRRRRRRRRRRHGAALPGTAATGERLAFLVDWRTTFTEERPTFWRAGAERRRPSNDAADVHAAQSDDERRLGRRRRRRQGGRFGAFDARFEAGLVGLVRRPGRETSRIRHACGTPPVAPFFFLF